MDNHTLPGLTAEVSGITNTVLALTWKYGHVFILMWYDKSVF